MAKIASTEVCSSVRQGSVLDHALLLICINFVVDGIRYKIFADNLKIYMRIAELGTR